MTRSALWRSRAWFLIRYGVSGGASATSHLGTALMLVELAGLNPEIATNVGFAVSVVVSYVLQRSWVFRSDAGHSRAIPRFLLVVAFGGLLNWSIVAAGTRVGVPYIYVQLVALVLIPISNLVLNRFFTFAQTADADGANR